MRIAGRTSSASRDARAVSLSREERLEGWRDRLAKVDWVPWLILALAAFLRLLLLGMKPPHFDEGINGWFVDQMTKNGFYRYDPTNYHGPLHFYILFLGQTLFGRGVWVLRMPVVLASLASVWLTFKFEPFVGRTVVRWAALAMAISPGFVFYGRYSIHEVWLLLFSMLFILGGLGLWRRGTAGYLWCVILGVAGMILTKETYIIHLGCAVLALLVAYVSHKITPAEDTKLAQQTWSYFDLVAALAVGFGAIIFFYSGTFLNWSGVKGLYLTFATWFETGSKGNGHEKPWHYWLMLSGRYEPAVVLGLLVCLFCQMFREISLRYLAIYGVGTLMAYSIVHYKTPWCIISIVWPFLFVFGAAVLLAPMKWKAWIYPASAVLLAAAAVACWLERQEATEFEFAWPFLFLGAAAILLVLLRFRQATTATLGLSLILALGLSIRLNYFRYTTDTEPYVYVQTYNDVFLLTRPLLKLAHQNPNNYQLVGHIIRSSAYPLPWMLGDFTRIGYYDGNTLPNPIDAAFLVVQEDKIAEVESKLQDSYYTAPFTIRSFQDTSKLFLNAKVFKNFFKDRAPEFTGHGPASTP